MGDPIEIGAYKKAWVSLSLSLSLCHLCRVLFSTGDVYGAKARDDACTSGDACDCTKTGMSRWSSHRPNPTLGIVKAPDTGFDTFTTELDCLGACSSGSAGVSGFLKCVLLCLPRAYSLPRDHRHGGTNELSKLALFFFD